MSLSIVIPLVVVAVVVVGGFAWYQRKMRELSPESGDRDMSALRLTGERLRTLEPPTWRVVYEIRGDTLGDVDHVVVGPPGVIAIVTLMMDRPVAETSDEPARIADAAVTRGAVDELAQRVGLDCELLAKVYWGAPQPDLEAAHEITHGAVAVEGQRLDEWLTSLPGHRLTPGQVDLAWQAIVTGIGRPDPLG